MTTSCPGANTCCWQNPSTHGFGTKEPFFFLAVSEKPLPSWSMQFTLSPHMSLRVHGMVPFFKSSKECLYLQASELSVHSVWTELQKWYLITYDTSCELKAPPPKFPPFLERRQHTGHNTGKARGAVINVLEAGPLQTALWLSL